MNIITTKTCVALVAALTVSACTTPAPTYKHLTPLPTDAQISFESDFKLHTHFSVNTERGGNCGKFETVGYLLKTDSVFIYNKPNTEILIKVPSGKTIGVAGYHAFSDPTYRSNCYPTGHFFTPKKNGAYVVKMNVVKVNNADKGCYISVAEVNSNGESTIVAYDSPPSCIK